MKIIIELPDIKAVSRNQTTGHFINYATQLTLAEKWMSVFGKKHEYHFIQPVDVLIEAYYKTQSKNQAADTPNIDDKIFTDILIRYKTIKQLGKMLRIERNPWFIEDDEPRYLRFVHKRSVPSDHYKVVITITEVNSD